MFENFMKEVSVTVYETNEKGQLKQNVRNAFKAEVMNALVETLKAQGLNVFQTVDGIAVEFENVEVGALTVVFDGTVKGFEYDAETAYNEFVEKQNEKAEKALKAEALKAQKMAEKELMLKQKAEKAKAKA